MVVTTASNSIYLNDPHDDPVDLAKWVVETFDGERLPVHPGTAELARVDHRGAVITVCQFGPHYCGVIHLDGLARTVDAVGAKIRRELDRRRHLAIRNHWGVTA